jgi:Fur family ferric uptake transcriptional regulator
MFDNNQFEKSNFRALIETDEIGNVEERLNVIDAFLGTEEHVTLEDLLRILRERGHDYEPDFVRRCMNRWVEQGFAQKKQFEGQPPRYEHRHLGQHHDHLICTKCRKIVEFSNPDMEKLQMQITAQRGFHMLQHKMEIYGLCSECVARRSPLLPLAMAKSGEMVIIKYVMGGKTAQARLASMGFRPGDLLEIISNNGHGRLIVGHECTRLALGRGIAQKIMVSLASHDQKLEWKEGLGKP